MKLRVKVQQPIFIEGLPGMGNVGKIVADLLVEQTGAKRIWTGPVDKEPGMVLVQPNNMVRYPELALYHYTRKGQEYLFLTGEGQPASESAIHALARNLVSLLVEVGCREIVTIGGIGLQHVPQEPRVYVTGTNRKLIRMFRQAGAENKIHGVVGPIIGLTGVLLGESKRKIPAVALLAESLAHPAYLGLRGAERVLHLLQVYDLPIDTSALQASIEAFESVLAPAGDVPKRPPEANYIG